MTEHRLPQMRCLVCAIQRVMHGKTRERVDYTLLFHANRVVRFFVAPLLLAFRATNLQRTPRQLTTGSRIAVRSRHLLHRQSLRRRFLRLNPTAPASPSPMQPRCCSIDARRALALRASSGHFRAHVSVAQTSIALLLFAAHASRAFIDILICAASVVFHVLVLHWLRFIARACWQAETVALVSFEPAAASGRTAARTVEEASSQCACHSLR